MSSEVTPAVPALAPLSGAKFLDELESKHSYVLDELEALNVRIESVLKLYVESRQVSGQGPAQPVEASALSNG